jgi:hypothetical protein
VTDDTLPSGVVGHYPYRMNVRPVSLPTHGATELLFGLVTLVAPFVLGFEPAAAVVTVVAGALVVGLAFSAVVEENVHVGNHHAADYGVAIGFLALAAIVGLTTDRTAMLYLAAAAVAHFALNLSTKYSAR